MINNKDTNLNNACNKISIISMYFGKLPLYFDLWMKSCEYNPNVDFLVFTDAKVMSKPKNVKIIPYTIGELKQTMEKKLEMPIVLDRAYKCCDYKPMYGFILSEYLIGYDYWGHCDLDLIFGDLEGYFHKYELYKYDKFLPLGHLCLYKNTDEVNKRFMYPDVPAGKYQDVVSSEKIFVFDETPGMHQLYKNHGFSEFEKRIFIDISVIYKRFRLARNDKNYNKQIFSWENGHIWREYLEDNSIKKEEFIYMHFKQRGTMEKHFNEEGFKAFYITNTGFYIKKSETALRDINMLNRYKGRIFEILEKLQFDIKDLRTRVYHKLKKKSK